MRSGLLLFIAVAVIAIAVWQGQQPDRADVAAPSLAPTSAHVVDTVLPPWRLARDEAVRVAKDDVAAALLHLERALSLASDASEDDRQTLLCERAQLWVARANGRRSDPRADSGAFRSAESDLREAKRSCRDPQLQRTAAHVHAMLLLHQARLPNNDNNRVRLLEESLLAERSSAALTDLAKLIDKEDPRRASLLLDEALVMMPTADGLGAWRDRLHKEAAVTADFEQARQQHFVVQYDGDRDENRAYRALALLEKAYFRVGQALQRYPTEPVVVMLMSGEQFRDVTAAPDWSGGIYDGKIRVRAGSVGDDDARLERVLAHEYVHALLATTVKTLVPIWFNEGLAQHHELVGVDAVALEKRTGTASWDMLQQPFLPLPAALAQQAYATSFAMVRSLVTARGDYGLAQLLAELNQRPFEAAFERTYAKQPADWFHSR
jgi:hypothetical protein